VTRKPKQKNHIFLAFLEKNLANWLNLAEKKLCPLLWFEISVFFWRLFTLWRRKKKPPQCELYKGFFFLGKKCAKVAIVWGKKGEKSPYLHKLSSPNGSSQTNRDLKTLFLFCWLMTFSQIWLSILLLDDCQSSTYLTKLKTIHSITYLLIIRQFLIFPSVL